MSITYKDPVRTAQ